MRRVIVFAPSYYPSRGGVEKHLFETNHHLKNTHHITVLVRYAASLPKHQVIDGIEVVRLPENIRFWRLALWRLAHSRLFRNISVIHSHDFFPWAFKRLFPHTRWIHTFHGYEGYPLQPEAIASRQRVRATVDYCYGVGQFIEQWYHTPCDELMYGATSLRPTVPAIKPHWDIIFYGRLEPDTGFRAYLEGFNILQQQLPETSMLALGGGSQQDWAAAYINEHKLNVTLKPAVADVQPYVEQARVAFVSGYLALAESAALAKPVVAVYETPLKHDYLACHPRAKDFWIVASPAEIATAAQAALKLKPSSKRLKEAQTWALEQSWQRIADSYAVQYDRR
jgi:glycosyltransferase involved in cell wall biosynthesis